MTFFGGIEGGASYSNLVIFNENGELIGSVSGLSTNHWMVGIPEVARRISDMVLQAKAKSGIPMETKLASLGLSLSGCEENNTNIKLKMELQNNFPDVSEHFFICSDTIGSLFTVSEKGGLVVIAGTGSNALLRNPDGTMFNCGGWGHILGDEGSAWSISHRALKVCFDDMDNLNPSPHSTECVWGLIKDHFNIKTRLELLHHCYEKFDKSFFARLCEKLALAATEGDLLSKLIFAEAGQQLAKNIEALLPKVSQELVESGCLNIFCVGSVWKSWNLMSDGFIKKLQDGTTHLSLNLNTITKSSAYGACYLGADSIKSSLSLKYSENYRPFFSYKPAFP